MSKSTSLTNNHRTKPNLFESNPLNFSFILDHVSVEDELKEDRETEELKSKDTKDLKEDTPGSEGEDEESDHEPIIKPTLLKRTSYN